MSRSDGPGADWGASGVEAAFLIAYAAAAALTKDLRLWSLRLE